MKRESQIDTNKFLKSLDQFKEIFVKTQFISPVELHTENRKDIDYRIFFLKNIYELKIEPKKTLYYHFISDRSRGVTRSAEEAVNKFLMLFEDIKHKGIKKPIIVGKYDKKILNTRYFTNGEIHKSNYKNSTGFQLIDGAHRLSIALYLNLKEIPVKIYSPFSFKIPDYATFLRLNEKHYLSKIREIE